MQIPAGIVDWRAPVVSGGNHVTVDDRSTMSRTPAPRKRTSSIGVGVDEDTNGESLCRRREEIGTRHASVRRFSAILERGLAYHASLTHARTLKSATNRGRKIERSLNSDHGLARRQIKAHQHLSLAPRVFFFRIGVGVDEVGTHHGKLCRNGAEALGKVRFGKRQYTRMPLTVLGRFECAFKGNYYHLAWRAIKANQQLNLATQKVHRSHRCRRASSQHASW